MLNEEEKQQMKDVVEKFESVRDVVRYIVENVPFDSEEKEERHLWDAFSQMNKQLAAVMTPNL